MKDKKFKLLNAIFYCKTLVGIQSRVKENIYAAKMSKIVAA